MVQLLGQLGASLTCATGTEAPAAGAADSRRTPAKSLSRVWIVRRWCRNGVWSSTRPLVAAHAAIASVIAISQAWQTPAPSTMPARVIAQFAPTWSATMLPAAKVTTAPAT